MYSYDFKRWEECRCECTTFSSYEVEILYKTEDYMKELRKEWEGNITEEELAERNWRLLIELEEAMVKV